MMTCESSRPGRDFPRLRSYLLCVLERKQSACGVVYYSSGLLEAVGVPHAFSTRIGGTSKAPFDSLNLGNPSGVATQDDWGNIHENYRRLQSVIGCENRQRCWVHQVHGGDVVQCSSAFESGPKADAMWTDDPQRLLSVRIADCVPVLLASIDGRKVAAVHAGWRGVLAGVAVNTVAAMQCDPDGVVAAIGPCISVDAFEVGPEVLSAFSAAFGKDLIVHGGHEGKGRIDLRGAIRHQLAGLGIERIDETDRCSFRHGDEFFSHRRDHGVTGRMAAVIGPANP
jgi:YfiH family protein